MKRQFHKFKLIVTDELGTESSTPFVVDLAQIDAYYQTSKGYVNIYLHSGEAFCLETNYDKFNELMVQSYKD